jgi:N-acyl-D-aspartate/D-glutamate deacylase
MGARAIGRNPATGQDIEMMSRLVRDAVAAGAAGFSTSRILTHQSLAGERVPGTFADEAELLSIAAAVKAGGGRTVQAIPAGSLSGLDAEEKASSTAEEVELFGRISRATGTRVIFTLQQNSTDPRAWRRMLDMTAGENSRGAELRPMTSGHCITGLMTLPGYHPFIQRPTFVSLKALPLPELVAAMHRPEIRRAILDESDVRDPQPGAGETSSSVM